MTKTTVAAVCVALAMIVTPVYAAPILISSTGATAEGAVDPNFSLVSGPTCPTGPCPAFVTVTDGYPLPAGWTGIPNSPTSKWIQPLSGTIDEHPAGTYTYRTTFDLTGLDPLSATISGQWATDNPGLDILINGVSTGQVSCCQYFFFSPFVISGGFVQGVNTLDFVVSNPSVTFPGNVTGLNVQILRAEASSVPEPATLSLLGLGLLAATVRRRRTRTARR